MQRNELERSHWSQHVVDARVVALAAAGLIGGCRRRGGDDAKTRAARVLQRSGNRCCYETALCAVDNRLRVARLVAASPTWVISYPGSLLCPAGLVLGDLLDMLCSHRATDSVAHDAIDQLQLNQSYFWFSSFPTLGY